MQDNDYTPCPTPTFSPTLPHYLQLCALFMEGLADPPREEQNIVPPLQQAVHVPRGHRHSPELLTRGEGGGGAKSLSSMDVVCKTMEPRISRLTGRRTLVFHRQCKH